MQVFHGAHGDQILSYVGARRIPKRGSEVCFELKDARLCFKHGVDTARKQSYVLVLDVDLPADPTLWERTSRHGNPDTLVVRADVPIRVLHMLVRAGRAGSFETFPVAANDVRKYLTSGWRAVNDALASS
ncbi:MAG: hypothetical protein M9894_33565 [Planctomycetes bacterium]|nr:hypothetical protein [Planctomycetota bacterium]